jgi:hypothetical protein
MDSFYLIRNEKLSKFFRAMPAPLATLCNGSSAMWNWMLILSCRRLVEATQQGATAGEIDAVLHDVGIQLWRRVLQSREHGVLYLGHRLVEAVGYLLIADGHFHGQCRDTVRSVNDVVLGSLVA